MAIRMSAYHHQTDQKLEGSSARICPAPSLAPYLPPPAVTIIPARNGRTNVHQDRKRGIATKTHPARSSPRRSAVSGAPENQPKGSRVTKTHTAAAMSIATAREPTLPPLGNSCSPRSRRAFAVLIALISVSVDLVIGCSPNAPDQRPGG